MTLRSVGRRALDQALDPHRESGSPSDRRLDVLLVVTAGMTLTLLRWFATRHRLVFELRSDEAGQLGYARTIGGGGPWNMLSNVTWRPGFGLLISPLNWLFDDPVSVYRGALAVNAVLGGIALTLIAWLVHDIAMLNWLWSTIVATVVSLLPGAFLVTNWVWSESLVTVVYLAVLVAAIRLYRAPSRTRASLLVAVAILAYLTHGRLSPLIVVSLAIVGVVVYQRRLDRRFSVVLASASVATILIADLVMGKLVDLIWTRARSTNTPGAVLDNVVEIRGLVGSTAGQIWYQQVSTAGLWTVGLVALAVVAFDRGATQTGSARIVLLVFSSVALLGFLFLAETPQARSDYVVYGRYLDAAGGPIVAIGLATVLVGDRSTRRRALTISAIVAVVAAAVVALLSTDRLEQGRLVRHMVIGLLPYVEFTNVIPVWRVTAIAALVGAALTFASARRGLSTFFAVGLAVVLVGVALERANPVVQRRANRFQAASDVATLRDSVIPPGVPFLFDLDPLVDGERRMYYQFYLPENRMFGLGDRDRAPSTSFVFAPIDDPDVDGGELVWTDPAVPLGLYRLPPERD